MKDAGLFQQEEFDTRYKDKIKTSGRLDEDKLDKFSHNLYYLISNIMTARSCTDITLQYKKCLKPNMQAFPMQARQHSSKYPHQTVNIGISCLADFKYNANQ